MENSFSKNSGDPGDPGGAAQVSDVAPEPSLLVEDGAVLGTRVHNRGPALAAPGSFLGGRGKSLSHLGT